MANSDVQTRTPHREHCISDPDARCVEIVISDLKVDARTQLTPIPTLYNGATAMLSVNPTIAPRFPLFGQLGSSLYRQRLSNLPTLPASRETLNFPANLQQTIYGANFLLYSSQGNEILIFATQENILKLSTKVHWCVDGTFKSVPHLYLQLFSIHAFEGDKLVPLDTAYFLLKHMSYIPSYFDLSKTMLAI